MMRQIISSLSTEALEKSGIGAAIALEIANPNTQLVLHTL
jgi:hypothetical protein